MLAVSGVLVVIAEATSSASKDGQLRGSASQLERDNAGGNGNDSIAKNHEDAGEKASRDRMGRDVPISYGGDGDDSPIHAGRDAGEAVLLTFDLIHQGANDDDNRENNKQEHDNFPEASEESGAKSGCFADKLGELEDAEDTQEAQRAKETEGVSDANEKA